jgi:glutamyl-tRNA synthetase
VYECFCSRAEVRAAAQARGSAAHSEASAPHGLADDGPRYPGTCRDLTRTQADERRRTRPPALRLRVPPGPVPFLDALCGPQRFDPQAEVGDFVVRRADGIHAYQLAVVLDDAAMGISQVLRGADLLASTSRQLLLYRMLGLPEPRWAHVPLLQLAGPGGVPQRLSKRDGADTLAGLRERGSRPEALVAWLARSAGLPVEGPCSAADLLGRFSLAQVGGAGPVSPAELPGAAGQAG